MTVFTLQVNGIAHEIDADPATPILFILRNQLGLTGAKLGCGLEQCGACTVLADGRPVLACVKAVSEFAGKEVVTVEGLTSDTVGGAVQRAFVAENAAQCGYCTPGLVTEVTALLAAKAKPTSAEIIEALNGHLCRCGSHTRVLKAIDRLVTETTNA